MLGVRITFAPTAAAALIPSPSSISKASDPSSTASTMASLSPGCRPALRNRSASAAVATSLHGKPRSHRCLHRTGDRQICSAGRDLPKYRPRDHDFAEKVAKQLEITQSGKIHERAGVGDDQGLPDLASSFEFADG